MKNRVRQKYESIHPDKIVTASNVISILRAFMVVPILYFLSEGQGNVALIFIAIAIASDALDGWLARISNEITDIGKVLDPVADKVVIFGVMLFLLFKEQMPRFYFLILVGRDLILALIGIYLLNNRKVTHQANRLGKIAVVFTAATILAFIYPQVVGGWVRPLMWTSIGLLTFSWLHYIYRFFGHIKKDGRSASTIKQGDKLTRGLAKTEHRIAARIPLLGKYFQMDAETINQIEETLLGADLGVELTEALVARLKQLRRSESTRLEEILKETLKQLVSHNDREERESKKLRIILFVGVNGTGKTTTIGKLANLYREQGKKIILVAADTFRAAAYDQLRVWAQRAAVDFMGNPKGKDPSAVVYDALQAAQARGTDVMMIDTAGRLHTKSNLMAELAKMKRVIAQQIPEAPHDIWLVLDANIGQNGIAQAREFGKTVGVNGLILTKLDGTAKGGAVLAIHHELSIPVRYLGVGEKIDDIIEFDPHAFIDALLHDG